MVVPTPHSAWPAIAKAPTKDSNIFPGCVRAPIMLGSLRPKAGKGIELEVYFNCSRRLQGDVRGIFRVLVAALRRSYFCGEKEFHSRTNL